MKPLNFLEELRLNAGVLIGLAMALLAALIVGGWL